MNEIHCNCPTPSICVMDYDKVSPSPKGHWTQPEPRINRVCTKCWTHWFGPPNRVRQFTRVQWDEYMRTAA